MFQKNVGTVDRVARILIGLFLMWYGYDYQSWWGLLGLVVLVTGAIGTCWLYRLFGVSTCPVKSVEVVMEVPPVNPTNG